MTDLTGRNIVIFDIETFKSAQDCLLCGQSAALHHVVPQTLGLPLTGEKPRPCTSFTPIGWDRYRELGLSIGCAFDFQDMAFHWFDVHTLASTLAQWVERQAYLVTFNGLAFDGPLLTAVLQDRWEQWAGKDATALVESFARLMHQGYDVLAAIWQADPARKFERGLNSLDAISVANGIGKKQMDGATAPRLWAHGRIAEVLNYCAGDVTKTRRLFELIDATGQLLRGDGQPLTVARPLVPQETR